jgi:hypothetical protein
MLPNQVGTAGFRRSRSIHHIDGERAPSNGIALAHPGGISSLGRSSVTAEHQPHHPLQTLIATIHTPGLPIALDPDQAEILNSRLAVQMPKKNRREIRRITLIIRQYQRPFPGRT